MTFPKTLKSIKLLIIAQILTIISQLLTIFVAGILISSSVNITDNLDNIPLHLLLLIIGLTALFLLTGVASVILCLISTHKASAEDANFKVAFYSTVISLFLYVLSIVFSANKEVENITELLVLLTELLAQVYILEGIRSICKQLGHPEMDKLGGFIYAVITTLFVVQTCVSVYILVLGGTMVTTRASWLSIVGSLLTIFSMILFLFYSNKTIKILSKE